LIGPDLRKVYNWIFIIGTTASAIWLAVAMFQHLESLVEELRAGSKGRQA
jgi:hypothetical protein